MGLREYKKKRDFEKTSEPKGRSGVRGRPEGLSGVRGRPARPLRYLIQKHDASRLHYDFRLEWDGVLKSWAVPKGPSLDPRERRLAVQVEDHPLEYGSFEGTIPKGEYGGGTVMLWDQGHWLPAEDASRGLSTGKLKFVIAGSKLQGGWTLVRMHGPRSDDGKSWLLIKERDAYARSTGARDPHLEDATSVATGRSMEEIAAGAKPKRAKPTRAKPKPPGPKQPRLQARKAAPAGRTSRKPSADRPGKDRPPVRSR